MNIGSAFLRSDFSPIDGSHAGDCARIEIDPINVRAKRCVIRDLSGLRGKSSDSGFIRGNSIRSLSQGCLISFLI